MLPAIAAARPTFVDEPGRRTTMNRLVIVWIVSVVFLATGIRAQDPSSAAAAPRDVRGQTLFSRELPAADFTFGKDFRYVGSQGVNLYGNADAEQHVFVKAGTDGVIERFYWLQFEHFLPTNTYTYDYKGGACDMGALTFICDVKSWPDYAAANAEDPKSDGAAISRMLASRKLTLPKKAARVRMFYLPTPDHRSELMIIYGEALPEDSTVPVRAGGVQLDKESPASARMFLDHMRADLLIRKH
jgi:hypothetical protein